MAAPLSRPVITLLTDFGTQDAYVGSMKGVILGLNPEVALVDLTHDLPPQDVMAGALVLAAAAPYFPAGTIHLAVVDPGVGSIRRALAARCQGQFWVGPDNGLFHLIFKASPDLKIVSLEASEYFRTPVSATFHGRDIFAPVAAHLSLGLELSCFGPGVMDPVALDIPEPALGPEEARGEIVYVDRFGNLVSNLAASDLKEWLGDRRFCLKLGPLRLRKLAHTYTDAAPGEFLALPGSHGWLEIACARDHAARRLDLGPGQAVVIHRE
jgi:S-adenosylmethionine hydrolase